MQLAGKSAIVTGASQGLGFEIARHLAREGANVAICARSGADVQAAEAELRAGLPDGVRLYAAACDVSVQDDAVRLVAAAVEAFGGLDIVVNNAGIQGPKGFLEDVDTGAFLDTIKVNLMGPVYLCKAAIPHLKKSGQGRIINLSGGGATAPRPGMSAYALSKTAVVRLTENLAEELAGTGICVNAIAPGVLATRMLDEMLAEAEGRVADAEYQKLKKLKEEGGGTPLSLAAELCVYLAGPQVAGVSGKLLSAVWDDWKHLDQHVKELDSDIYTLRRIVPADRGLDF